MPFQIRLSDHDWSGYNGTRQAQVVKNALLRPTTADQIEPLALSLAIGFLVLADVRRGALGAKKRDRRPRS